MERKTDDRRISTQGSPLLFSIRRGCFRAAVRPPVLVDVILDSSAISGTFTGRLVSACSSMVLLGGGYFLIVDSFVMSLFMAGAVCKLLLVVSSVMGQRGWPSAVAEQST